MERIFLAIMASLAASEVVKCERLHQATGMKQASNSKSPLQVVLLGGSTPSQGNVYILNSEGEVAGPVCDDNWGDADAQVVCRQLGYRHGLPTWDSWFGEVEGEFSMDEVNCNGDEDGLQNCHHISRTQKCKRTEGAGVICSNATNTGPAAKCECNGITGKDKWTGDTVGECKDKYDHGALFCFVDATSHCIDKGRTNADYNPGNEEYKRFYSILACYEPHQVPVGGSVSVICPIDSIPCGHDCLPPGQDARNDYHLYCCSDTTTNSDGTSSTISSLARMDQQCHGNCGFGSSYVHSRSLCGSACIYDDSFWGEVFCCGNETLAKGEMCNGYVARLGMASGGEGVAGRPVIVLAFVAAVALVAAATVDTHLVGINSQF